ncbi:hypothetical protein [uncultured Enterovirga sp.]|uniref:hypothetical protein n=1 Tax=uncultured Enterovirga sp. TaxID=2026352 RepID=UPI0035CBBCCC
MLIWTVLLGGPLMLPLALMMRADVPELIAEAMVVAGVIGLFLAICATEVVGTGQRRPASD